MPLVESYNGSVDLFLVSCISLSYAAGRVLQRFSGFFSSVLCKSLSYCAGRVLQRFSGFVSSFANKFGLKSFSFSCSLTSILQFRL